jgi:hypothetical protein
MNHKWDNNKCKVCWCKRTIEHGHVLYERSGMSFFERMPSCIDWNDNTLD